jgi:hypothetical protein
MGKSLRESRDASVRPPEDEDFRAVAPYGAKVAHIRDALNAAGLSPP